MTPWTVRALGWVAAIACATACSATGAVPAGEGDGGARGEAGPAPLDATAATQDATPDVASGTAPDDGPIDVGSDATAPSRCATPLRWSLVAGSPAGIALSGSGPTDIWALGLTTVSSLPGNTVMRGDGTTWTAVPLTSCPEVPASLFAIWVAGPGDVHVAGCMGAGGTHTRHHWNGSSWAGFDTGDNRAVMALWGSSPLDVWASSDLRTSGFSSRWDGTAWSMETTSHGLLAGAATSDFWVYDLWAGYPGILGHHRPNLGAQNAPDSGSFYDRSDALTVIDPPSGGCDASAICLPVHAGWATATDDVWFVGEQGHALHYDGAAWRVDVTPGGSTLQGVWGSSRADVWAVGSRGTIVHFDGATWSAVASPTTEGLAAVWGSGPCDVWAIGDAIYHGAP